MLPSAGFGLLYSVLSLHSPEVSTAFLTAAADHVAGVKTVVNHVTAVADHVAGTAVAGHVAGTVAVSHVAGSATVALVTKSAVMTTQPAAVWPTPA